MDSPERTSDFLTQEEIEKERQRLDDEVARLLRARRRLDLRTTSEVALGLRDWQREALDAWVAADQRGVIEAVTGTGKTRVGIAAIEQAYRDGERAIVLVPTNVLREQWQVTLNTLLPHLTVTTAPHEAKAEPWDVAVVTPIIAARYDFLSMGERALLVADEAHRYGSPEYRKALSEARFSKRLGLTATLERGDEGDDALADFFGGICYSLGYERAKTDNLIAPFKIAFVKVPFAPYEAETYAEITEDMSSLRFKLSNVVPLTPIGEFMAGVRRLTNDRSHEKSGLARWYLKRFSDRRELFANSVQKHRALQALMPVVQSSQGTLVFTQTKFAARAVSRLFNEAAVQAAVIDADVSNEDRADLIAEFGDGALKALAAPVVFDEGVDIPNADLGIVITATHRRRQMVQRFGRVLRKKPDGSIARFVILVLGGSSEDPTQSDHEQTFADELAHLAVAAENFDLSIDEELARLISFLDPNSEAGPNPFTAEKNDATDVDDSPSDTETVLVEGIEVDRRERVRTRKRHDPDPYEPVRSDAALKIWFNRDSYQDYRTRIRRFDVLSAEKEVQLAKEIEIGLTAANRLAEGRYQNRVERRLLQQIEQSGRRALDRFIRANLRLVASIAHREYKVWSKRYPTLVSSLDALDLIQFGNDGLVRAIHKFDYKVGNKFSTYATWWIRQSIVRGVMDTAHNIRIPVHAQEAWQRGERNPDVVRAIGPHRPIHEVADCELPDSYTAGIQEVESDLDRERLLEAVWLIVPDSRDQFILTRRFGLDGEPPATLDAIGSELGVTRERIRQLEKSILKQLRGDPFLCAVADRPLADRSALDEPETTQQATGKAVRATPPKKDAQATGQAVRATPPKKVAEAEDKAVRATPPMKVAEAESEGSGKKSTGRKSRIGQVLKRAAASLPTQSD